MPAIFPLQILKNGLSVNRKGVVFIHFLGSLFLWFLLSSVLLEKVSLTRLI